MLPVNHRSGITLYSRILNQLLALEISADIKLGSSLEKYLKEHDLIILLSELTISVLGYSPVKINSRLFQKYICPCI